MGMAKTVTTGDPHELMLPIEVVPLSDDIVSVFVHGEIDLAEAGELRAVLNDACSGQHGTVLVDLSGVSFMGSSAMGVLAQTTHELAQAGRRLELTGLQPRVVRAFQVVGLDRALNLVDIELP
jgi:anti-sigma B factor antagonist